MSEPEPKRDVVDDIIDGIRRTLRDLEILINPEKRPKPVPVPVPVRPNDDPRRRTPPYR